MKRIPSRVIHLIRIRPRLFLAAAATLVLGVALPDTLAAYPVTRWLIAWNAGCVLYVGLATHMMHGSSPEAMRRRARVQDDGQTTLLVLVALATLASLAAIAKELAVVRDLHGWSRGLHVALAGSTVLCSWAFIQMMFALHYAHEYVAAAARGSEPVLLFPGTEEPGYADFFYFAAVIGTSGQTADVAFASRALRQVGTLHCILAYLFNTTVLALLINIGAGLF